MRVYAPRVTSPRRPAWCTCSRDPRGSSPTIHAQMVRPSSRKKNVQNSAMSAPAATWATVVVACSAPVTSSELPPLSDPWIWSIQPVDVGGRQLQRALPRASR